jgi:hypothetical protein
MTKKFDKIAGKVINEAGSFSMAKTGDLMFKLDAISQDFSNDPVKIIFANIATKTLQLLQGVDKYSKKPPRLSPQQLKAAHQIGQIVTAIYGPVESSEDEYGDNDEFLDDLPSAEDIQDKNPMRGRWGKGEY